MGLTWEWYGRFEGICVGLHFVAFVCIQTDSNGNLLRDLFRGRFVLSCFLSFWCLDLGANNLWVAACGQSLMSVAPSSGESTSFKKYDHETLVEIREKSKFDLSAAELQRLRDMEVTPDDGDRNEPAPGLLDELTGKPRAGSLPPTPPLSPLPKVSIPISPGLPSSPQPMTPPPMLDNRADHAFRVSNPEDDRSRMIKQVILRTKSVKN